ncbi:MAG: hypothetical protein OEU86_07755 [Gammaproteobacteria bacterium]|nr:hypothetical protein [Gammaproteobacteria bacterium]
MPTASQITAVQRPSVNSHNLNLQTGMVHAINNLQHPKQQPACLAMSRHTNKNNIESVSMLFSRPPGGFFLLTKNRNLKLALKTGAGHHFLERNLISVSGINMRSAPISGFRQHKSDAERLVQAYQHGYGS